MAAKRERKLRRPAARRRRTAHRSHVFQECLVAPESLQHLRRPISRENGPGLGLLVPRASYTESAVAAVPPAPERRRPRRGSLERPVNGRLYRGTWLFVGLPLLVLAFSVARPPALQPPSLPAAFDPAAAKQIADDLALHSPIRAPGTAGASAAARWFAAELETPYGYTVQTEAFTASLPGQGRVRLRNLLARKSGLSLKTIVVMAHRDDSGAGAGANDNASGTAALIELARTYAPTAVGARLRLPYTLLFLSTDGAGNGALGAAEFAAHSPERQNVIAVINLDAIAGAGLPRLELAGDLPRSPSAGLVETVRSVLAHEVGAEPSRTSAARQLIDLAFPFSLYEQAPFVARGTPAVTITTGGDRPASGFADVPARVSATRLGQIGRATQHALDALEQGVALNPGPSSYLYLGSRIVRAWALEIVLVAALLPFLAATVDLFARCRRRRIRVAPAVRSYRSRLGVWLWCGCLFGLFSLLGIWPNGPARPPALDSVRWPAPALVALLVVATNPFALIFLLPSLHVWLWLPQVRASPFWTRTAVLLLGFSGPAVLVWSFAVRYGLGFDAPWYIASLYARGYAPRPGLVIALGWAAAAGQLLALAA